MTIICINCGNFRFFESEIEHTLELLPNGPDLLVQPAETEDWQYAEESVRAQISENVNSTLKMSAEELHYDPVSGNYFNPYLSCSVCHSPQVSRKLSEYLPKLPAPDLDSELLQNINNLKQLKAQRKAHEHQLPVLWQPS